MLRYRKDPLIRHARERHAREQRRPSLIVAVRVTHDGRLYECPSLPLYDSAELTMVVTRDAAPFVVASELEDATLYISAIPPDRNGPPLFVWRTKRPRGNCWRSLDLHSRTVDHTSHCRIRLLDDPQLEPD